MGKHLLLPLYVDIALSNKLMVHAAYQSKKVVNITLSF
jgi:hypothetical protein